MLFRETLIGPRWLAIAGASTLVFLALIAVISVPVVADNAMEIGGWVIALLIVAFVLILGAGLIGLTRRTHVSVTDTHIDAHLAPFRVMHIALSEVDDTKVADVTPRQAGGIGWRAVGSDRFVVWSAGPAVWVKLTDGASRVLRTERAPDLQAAIEGAVQASRR